MSATNQLPPSVDDPRGGQQRRGPWRRPKPPAEGIAPDEQAREIPVPPGRHRRTAVIAGAAVSAVAVTAGAVVLLTRPGLPDGAPNAPIPLPARVAGLSPLADEADLTQRPDFRHKAVEVGSGATVVGRTYGSKGVARTVRVVAGRTDLTGKLDLTWGADSGHEVGETRCTNNTMVTPMSPPRIRPTVMLCWRTTERFSAYALIIDPKAATPVADTDGAAAVEAAWQAALKK